MFSYKDVSIKSFNNDTSKRWYVQYYFFNEATNKYERKRLFMDINREKNAAKRLYLAKCLKEAITILLEQGFNPNQYFDSDKLNGQNEIPTLVEAINSVTQLEKTQLKHNTTSSTKYIYKIFTDWCIHQGFGYLDCKEFTKAKAVEFLAHTQKSRNISNRTRNNYRTSLHTLFSKFAEMELIDVNPITYISKLPEKSQKHKVHSKAQVKKVAEYCKEHEPQLYLLMHFIMFAFLRIETAVKVQVKHIDFVNNKLLVPAENEKPGTTIYKPLFGSLLQLLESMQLHRYSGEHYIFNTHSSGELLPSTSEPLRDYYTKRFLKRVKRPLNIGADYTLYSFRHTAISDLYTNFRKQMSREEAESRLLSITGHQTRDALRKYLREIGAEMPDDYSGFYSIEL